MDGVFSERLIKMRRERGLSQRAAASLIGIQPTSLSSYESGRKSPNLEIAAKIAAAYGCSLDWLCGFAQDKEHEMMTRADVFRHLTALCESGIPVSIEQNTVSSDRFAQPSFKESRIRDVEALAIYLTGDWLLEFGTKYERLLRLYLEKDIDGEVLEAWKKARFDAADNIAAVDSLCDSDELPW